MHTRTMFALTTSQDGTHYSSDDLLRSTTSGQHLESMLDYTSLVNQVCHSRSRSTVRIPYKGIVAIVTLVSGRKSNSKMRWGAVAITTWA